MPTLKATARHQFIVDALVERGRVEVETLSERLGVSTVTIRADLLHLERMQALRRVRGGAIAARLSRYEQSLDLGTPVHERAKAMIATVAASMIGDGETIIMDTGSTVEALSLVFPDHLTDVAIVTNALNVALQLSTRPGLTVIVTGGTVRPRLNSLVSPFGTQLLSNVNADVAFLSCAGVDPVKGFTNGNAHEAEIKHHMIRAANRAVFLADHSKLQHVASTRIVDLAGADLLITDQGASPAAVRELRSAGLDVVVASGTRGNGERRDR